LSVGHIELLPRASRAMCGCRLVSLSVFFFFFNDTATTEIYTLSLHDALPISVCRKLAVCPRVCPTGYATPWSCPPKQLRTAHPFGDQDQHAEDEGDQ